MSSARGWCKYIDTYLKESEEELYKTKDYSYPSRESGIDTIDSVKKICLETSIKGINLLLLAWTMTCRSFITILQKRNSVLQFIIGW